MATVDAANEHRICAISVANRTGTVKAEQAEEPISGCAARSAISLARSIYIAISERSVLAGTPNRSSQGRSSQPGDHCAVTLVVLRAALGPTRTHRRKTRAGTFVAKSVDAR